MRKPKKSSPQQQQEVPGPSVESPPTRRMASLTDTAEPEEPLTDLEGSELDDFTGSDSSQQRDIPGQEEPRTVGTAPKAGTFWNRIAVMPAEEWENGQLVMYLYRLQPFTDRTASGKTYVFVAKYTSPMTIDQIMQEEGSGKYRLLVNRSEVGTTAGKVVCGCEFRIMNYKYPPRIPPGEWVDDPRNKPWAWAKPAVQAAIDRAETAAQPPADPIAIAERMNATIDRRVQQAIHQQPAAQTGLSGIAPLLEVIAKATSPTVIVETMKTMMGLTQSHANPDSSMVKLLMDQNSELRTEVRELRNIMMTAQKSGQTKSLVEQIKEWGESQSMLKGFFRHVTGEAATPGWDEVLPGMVKDLASEVLPAVPLMIQAMYAKQQPPAQPQYRQQPPQPPPPTISGEASPQPIQIGAYLRTLAEIQPIIMAYLRNGQSGDEFADWFEGTFGPLTYGQLKTLGAEKILMAFRMSPVWPELQPIEPQFREFVRQFVTWEPDQEAKEEPPAPTTEAEIIDQEPEDFTK